MVQKEVNEIRRRIAPEKNNIQKIYGCYVSLSKAIIAEFEQSMSMLSEQETEKYLSLLRSGIGGSVGRNLLEIQFSIEKVNDSDEHRMLAAMRRSALSDEESRKKFFESVAASLTIEDANYVILAASDTYDVPRKRRDDSEDESESMFTYILCAVCPVKDGNLELSYSTAESSFRGFLPNQIVASPVVGFMYPAFDSRRANIYSALYFTKNIAEIHPEFIEGVLKAEVPMSAEEQKDAFSGAIAESLDDDCSFEVVRSIHERIRDRIDEHKDTKDPDPLEITTYDVCSMLADSGVKDEHVEQFRNRCGEEFGSAAALDPVNIIDTKKFELVTPEVKITVDPKCIDIIETREIDGRKYILIPADSGVELNGLNVSV